MIKISKTITLNLVLLFTLGMVTSYAQTSTETIDVLILKKQNFNKNNKNSKVFKVQIYNGSEDEAYKTEKEFMLEFPDYKATVVYNKPEFKTQIGNFKTRLEADRALKIIKEKFAGAIVLKDKI